MKPPRRPSLFSIRSMRSSRPRTCRVLRSSQDTTRKTKTGLSSSGLNTAKLDQDKLTPSPQFIKGTSTAGNQSRFLISTTPRENSESRSLLLAKRSSLLDFLYCSLTKTPICSKKESTSANKDNKLSRLSSDSPTSLILSQQKLFQLSLKREEFIS